MPFNFPHQSPCDWVGDRLPLFVDDDLPSTERRVVERHLIVCERCRSNQSAQSAALDVLMTVAGVDPSDHAAGHAEFTSLWPSIARQIQDAKHESKASTFSWEGATSWGFDTWEKVFDSLARLARPFIGSPSLRFRWIPVAMSALLVVSFSVLGVGAWVRWTEHLSREELAVAARPIRQSETPAVTRARGPALPSEDSQVASNENNPSRPDRVSPSSRFSYDLDHGTPMGPNSIDIKPSY